MAVVTQYAYPLAINGSSPGNGDGGGSWLNVAAGDIDDPQGGPDDSDFAYFDPFNATQFTADYSLTALPVGVGINWVKLWVRVWCRSFNATVVDHTAYPYVRISGTRYDGAVNTIFGTTNAIGNNPQWISHQFTVDPSTGVAWTLTGLGAAKIGIKAISGNPAGTSTPYFKVSSMYIEMETVPNAASVDKYRTQLSHSLRLDRRPKRIVSITVPECYGDNDVGDNVWLSHPNFPSYGQPGEIGLAADPVGVGLAENAWSREPLVVLGRESDPDSGMIKLRCLMPRDYACGFWSPLYNNLATDELNFSGLAKVDAGGGWATIRSRETYGEAVNASGLRPFAVNTPLLSRRGLHAEVSRNWLKNSSFSQGAGNTFTDWTPNTAGTATITQDITDYLTDVNGLRRSVKFTSGTGNCFLTQPVNGIGNVTFRLAFDYKNISGSGKFYWLLRSDTASKDWVESSQTWVALGGNWNPAPVSANWARYISKQITAVGGGNNYTVMVGCIDTTSVVECYQVDAVTSSFVMPELRTITTTAAMTTVVTDDTQMNNDLTTRIMDATRGTLMLDVIPSWDHTDHADGTSLYLFSAGHSSTDSESVFYTKVNSGTGTLTYRRTRNSSNFDAVYTVPAIWVRGTTYKIAVRWHSVQGELGLASRVFYLFYNGALVTGNVIPSDMTQSAGPWTSGTFPRFFIGEAIGTANPFNGLVRNLEILPWCLPDSEIARRFNSY